MSVQCTARQPGNGNVGRMEPQAGPGGYDEAVAKRLCTDSRASEDLPPAIVDLVILRSITALIWASCEERWRAARTSIVSS